MLKNFTTIEYILFIIFIVFVIIIFILIIISIVLYYNNFDNKKNYFEFNYIKSDNILIPNFINKNNKIIAHLNIFENKNIEIIGDNVIIYSLPSGYIFSKIDKKSNITFYSGDYLLISNNKFTYNCK